MDSIREYLTFMGSRGLLLDIDRTVRREDIPELTDRLSSRAMVLMFRRVEGYGCGVVTNLVPSHEALGLLLAGDDPYALFLERIRDRREKVPVGRDGSLTSVDMEERDLLSFLPILRHCEKDSAPFITTGIISAVDPDSGVVGRGIHRMEYRGGNRLGVTLINPPLADIYRKYEARGGRMPLCATLGVDPLLFLSMALKVSYERDKLEVAGALKGSGVKAMQCVESAIDVPAGAEFYLEGYVDSGDMRRDGPLGEISGYYLTMEKTPTFVVNRLLHRQDPIYHGLLPVGPEGDTYLTFVSRAHVQDSVKKLFPFIDDISFVPKTFGSSVVVSVGSAERSKIRSLILSMMAFPMIKKVVVVDEDIDCRSLADVEWAVVTRCEASRDIVIVPNLQGQPIDPGAPLGLGVAKMGIDATIQGKGMEERARVVRGEPARIEELMKSLEVLR